MKTCRVNMARLVTPLLVTLIMSFYVAGCEYMGYIPREDFDALLMEYEEVKEERDELKMRVSELEDALDEILSAASLSEAWDIAESVL